MPTLLIINIELKCNLEHFPNTTQDYLYIFRISYFKYIEEVVLWKIKSENYKNCIWL